MTLMLPNDAQELFKNGVGTLYQSASTRQFYLVFQGVTQAFNAIQFSRLKARLAAVQPEELLLSQTLCDTEVVYLPSIDVLLVMRVQEMIGLKDLFTGAATMLELTAILYQRVYNVLI